MKPLEYINKFRMVSYYNQARIVRALGKNEVKTILEVGIRNSLFSNLLKMENYEVTTADLEQEYHPDILLDLTTDFKLPEEKFDAIVLFQVLEHIPYENFEKSLTRLASFTKKYIVISLPYQSLFLAWQFHASFAWRTRHILLQLPKFWMKQPAGSDHCWEMGIDGYPKKRIVNSIEKSGLKIQREFQDPYNPYHYFFVLKK